MEKFIATLHNTPEEIKSFVERLEVQRQPFSARELQEIIRVLRRLQDKTSTLRSQATTPRQNVALDAGDEKRLREHRRKFDEIDALIVRKVHQAESRYCNENTVKNLEEAPNCKAWADDLDVESGALSDAEYSELENRLQWVFDALSPYDLAVLSPDRDPAIDNQRSTLEDVENALQAKKDKHDELYGIG
ncbi:uncharacterized protein F4812DRAFT_468690 [Daldinia caldariorum]|uniref:uncharacterized protein n=1 Tax=Daldinia caldariorum TaxID=326644 RepID=UPI0020082D39|nr:uncharacterized protein F4812DRAFT_468690 [Daldinia caldariorum]KAI1463361.1 hypothetical protein F4812DRAFT_468690 [Daldinia caldariorum]